MQTLQKTWKFCKIQLTQSLKFSKSIPPHDNHDLNYVQRMLQAQYLTHPQEALEPQWRYPHQAPKLKCLSQISNMFWHWCLYI